VPWRRVVVTPLWCPPGTRTFLTTWQDEWQTATSADIPTEKYWWFMRNELNECLFTWLMFMMVSRCFPFIREH
jgi:hypothetical protein